MKEPIICLCPPSEAWNIHPESPLQCVGLVVATTVDGAKTEQLALAALTAVVARNYQGVVLVASSRIAIDNRNGLFYASLLGDGYRLLS